MSVKSQIAFVKYCGWMGAAAVLRKVSDALFSLLPDVPPYREPTIPRGNRGQMSSEDLYRATTRH